jgi:hypothetical protein
MGLVVKMRRVLWTETWRVIAFRYPPINLFERLSSNPAVWEALIELEELTNPRLRVTSIPPEKATDRIEILV